MKTYMEREQILARINRKKWGMPWDCDPRPALIRMPKNIWAKPFAFMFFNVCKLMLPKNVMLASVQRNQIQT